MKRFKQKMKNLWFWTKQVFNVRNYIMWLRYPYMFARKYCSDKFVFPLCSWEYSVPKGWHDWFMQEMEDIRKVLTWSQKWTLIFLEVKEKYNTLRVYTNGAPDEVEDIISNYDQLAANICVDCGGVATKETMGYYASYCDKCYAAGGFRDGHSTDAVIITKWIAHKFNSNDVTHDCADIWNRYLESRKRGARSGSRA